MTREDRGLAQFARVAMVMRRFARVITFSAPVSAVMCVVAGVARIFGVRLQGRERSPAALGHASVDLTHVAVRRSP